MNEFIKNQFPMLSTKIDSKRLVYLDSASNNLKPKQVVDRICKHYLEESSNVHRGAHSLSQNATDLYESARKELSNFINSSCPEQIIFSKGSTESLNMLASCLTLSSGDEILLTEMEHHSNIVPWLNLAKKLGCKVKFLPVLSNGKLDLKSLNKFLNKNTKIFSFTYVSNVLGVRNDIEFLIRESCKVGAITVVDAAQALAHIPIDVDKLNCDFLVASSHKCFGPTGVGFLYGKKEHLDKLEPYQFGGAMIDTVTKENFTLTDIPHRFEAGTPNIAGVIGFAEAIRFVKKYLLMQLEIMSWNLLNMQKKN